MRCEVKLYVAGKVFTETVHGARDYQEAKEVALKHGSYSSSDTSGHVMSVNANGLLVMGMIVSKPQLFVGLVFGFFLSIRT